MQWTKPDFQDIVLGMEVTAYVNTDDRSIDTPSAKRDDDPDSSVRESARD